MHILSRGDHIVRDAKRASGSRARTKQQCDQLGVAERLGAGTQQFLARSIIDRHGCHGAGPFMVVD
jgi:hypothetical protein